MEFWKDETEPIKAFLALFENAKKDPELSEGLKKVNQLIWFDYTEDGPNCSFHVDCRNGEIKSRVGKPNPVMAITRKKIRVKGSATGLLKLAPKLKRVASIYGDTLREMGWESKIIA